ncbi:MAG TPA: pyrroline-5-carboxylate reductase [Thiotrichales bacterium]|nr:pyrroline-5-carboxylate reductase [Thiotrichales bacterium]
MTAIIGFIGGGNMAASLIGGMIQAGRAASEIIVAEPDIERGQALSQQFGVVTTQDNTATLQCDSLILAVKPQVMRKVCEQLQTAMGSPAPLFISIAAGIVSRDIDRWLGGDRAIVRCMPNTPALLQCGATGMVANERVSTAQKQLAETILAAVGLTVWVESEDQINAVTAVSGSGPAYFFLMMEAMQAAGEQLGLTADTAQQLVLQTALGAARMASEKQIPPATLRQQVTSKGGTTEQAIASFERNHFRQIVMQALQAANDRSISLAEELAKA